MVVLRGGAVAYEQGTPVLTWGDAGGEGGGGGEAHGALVCPVPSRDEHLMFRKCVRELQARVAPPKTQGILVSGHAGRVINKLCTFSWEVGSQTPSLQMERENMY